MLTVEQIVRLTNGQLLQGEEKTFITSVHFDSRHMENQALFVALTGGTRDGHDFLADALRKGAVAALISNPDQDVEQLHNLCLILVQDTEKAFQKLAKAYREQLDIPLIAITGSNGKTTTKDMLAHLLAGKFNVYKTHKNLNNHLGLPLSLLQIKDTHEAAVLELGMNHPGEIDFLASIAQPSISIITNIGDAHIEYFGSKANIARAKGELLPHTDPNQYILLNADDPYVLDLASTYAGKTFTYSVRKEADVFATNITFTDQGTFFQLHVDQQSVECLLPMFGQHNVANLLPGAFIAYRFGCTLEDIQEQLLSLTISDMRFEMVRGPGGSILINDAYNASPTSMKMAIDTFKHIYPQRHKVLVLGDMYELGAEADQLHADIGHHVRETDMTVITVGEKAALIADRAGGTHAGSKEKAVQLLQPYLNDTYAILFKASRGLALENIITTLNRVGK